MKKRGASILFVMTLLYLVGCKSSEQKAYERAVEQERRAWEAYQDAQNDYNQLKKDIDEYNDLINQINNAK